MEEKLTVEIFIDNDSLDILSCVHKKELSLANLHNFISSIIYKKYIKIDAYVVSGDSNVLSDRKLEATLTLSENPDKEGNLNFKWFVDPSKQDSKISINLKGREKNHKVVLFSDLKNELLMNKNNGSYFYNIDSLLSGRFIDNLLEELCSE
jgi:hypothetical protein